MEKESVMYTINCCGYLDGFGAFIRCVLCKEELYDRYVFLEDTEYQSSKAYFKSPEEAENCWKENSQKIIYDSFRDRSIKIVSGGQEHKMIYIVKVSKSIEKVIPYNKLDTHIEELIDIDEYVRLPYVFNYDKNIFNYDKKEK